MKLFNKVPIVAVLGLVIAAPVQAELTTEQRRMIPESNKAIQCIVFGQIVKEEEATIDRYRALGFKYHNKQAVQMIFNSTHSTFSRVERGMDQQYRTFGGDPDRFANYIGELYDRKCLPLLGY